MRAELEISHYEFLSGQDLGKFLWDYPEKLTTEVNFEITVLVLRLNSHAVGMAVTRPHGFEIDFVRNPISGSAARFSLVFSNSF